MRSHVSAAGDARLRRERVDAPSRCGGIYLNGGARGFLVEIAPSELMRVLNPKPVDVAIP